VDMMLAYSALGRFDEAKAVFDEAMERKLDAETLRINRYALAFVERDATAMQQQLEWAKGKPGYSDRLLAGQADATAFYGQMAAARQLSLRAMEEATKAKATERAEEFRVAAAWREAEVGNATIAREWANAALMATDSRFVKAWAALALARIGDIGKVEKLASELEHEEAQNTVMQRNTLPSIRALVELKRNNPQRAIEILEKSPPYDMGPGPYAALEPVYVRGLAYLQARKGREAVAEFEKVVQYRGMVEPSITGAVVHLQLGRAYAMAGDTDQARTEYQNFLGLWKDADPDVTILKQAKAEYAKLK